MGICGDQGRQGSRTFPPPQHPLPREGLAVSDLLPEWLPKRPQIFPTPHHHRLQGPSSRQGLPGCSRLGSAWCPAAGKVLARPACTTSSTRDFQGIKGLSGEKSLLQEIKSLPRIPTQYLGQLGPRRSKARTPSPFQHDPPAMCGRQRARPGIGHGGSREEVLVWGWSSSDTHLAPSCIPLPWPGTRPMAKPPTGGDAGHMHPCHHLRLATAVCRREQDSCLQPAHPAGMPAMRSRQAPSAPHSSEPKWWQIPATLHCPHSAATVPPHARGFALAPNSPRAARSLASRCHPPPPTPPGAAMGQGSPHSHRCCSGRGAGPVAGACWRKRADGPRGHRVPRCPRSGHKGPALPGRGC